MPRRQPEFAAIQREYFEAAEVERFLWTTGAQGFAETEDELLAPLLEQATAPCLEVGCGEGSNLVRLDRRVKCFGVDLFPQKLAFAARELPGASFAVAEASRLPFPSACFVTVFIRDLLHHVPSPRAVLEEATRVLAPGGALMLLEPNGRNPIVRLQTHLMAAEAGARASNPEHIRQLMQGLPLRDVEVRTRQPLPLRRMLLHYRFGLPVLGRWALSRLALSAIEKILGRLLTPPRWSYVLATATRVE
jgi:ubiquinone/menaquinone biosynthesis C-methylase UbiE